MSGMYTQAPAPGASATRGNSLSFGLGMGAESSHTCRMPPFKGSSSRRALNYLPLVSSDALTLLVCYIWKLHLRNLEIAQTPCAISRLRKHLVQSQDWLHNLKIGTQFPVSENAQCNLKVVQIPRLCGAYTLNPFNSKLWRSYTTWLVKPILLPRVSTYISPSIASMDIHFSAMLISHHIVECWEILMVLYRS